MNRRCAHLLFNNSIYRNGVLGIDLGLGTPTMNDPGDPDLGANRQQNFPVLIAVSNNGSNIRVVWTLDSVPTNPFVLEFYGSTGPDPTTYGEGEYSLGWVGPVTTQPTGLLGGTNLFPTPNPPPNFITALASHFTLRDTSEFSLRILLDSDSDGMGDGYEAVHFGGYTNGQPGADADFDTVSNLDEFRADTNPQDSNSFFRVKGVAVSGNNFILTTPYSPERSYQVQACRNLVTNLTPWAPRSAVLTHTVDEATMRGTRGTNIEAYRAISLLP